MLQCIKSFVPRAFSQEIDPQKPVNMDVEYWRPVFSTTHLGGTPKDVFNNSAEPLEGPYVPCTPEKCGPLPNEVYASEPLLNQDGTPHLKRYVKHLQDAPENPMNAFMLWGTVGAATLGTIGLLAGSAFDVPVLGGLAGALIGGLAVGAVGAHRAAGDRIKLQWTVYPIPYTSYAGYKEQITPATQNGQQGYMHHYVPVLKTARVGEYKIPSIIHYKAGKEPKSGS